MPLHRNLVLPFTSQTQGGGAGAGELSKGILAFLVSREANFLNFYRTMILPDPMEVLLHNYHSCNI